MIEKKTKEKIILGLTGAISGIAIGSALATNLYQRSNIDGIILKKFTILEQILKDYETKGPNNKRIKKIKEKTLITTKEQEELNYIVNIRNKLTHEAANIDENEKQRVSKLIDYYIKKLSK